VDSVAPSPVVPLGPDSSPTASAPAGAEEISAIATTTVEKASQRGWRNFFNYPAFL
jgi:hypothetical protein